MDKARTKIGFGRVKGNLLLHSVDRHANRVYLLAHFIAPNVHILKSANRFDL